MKQFRNVPAAAPARTAKGSVLAGGGAVCAHRSRFFLPFYIMDGGFFHYAGDFNSQQISFTAI